MSNDTFKWDDGLAFQFAEFFRANQTKPYHRYWGRDLLNEFKQSKMPKQSYQILSYVTDYFSGQCDLFQFIADGWFACNTTYRTTWSEVELTKKGADIHSVKRLSDGAILKIGTHTSKGCIIRFREDVHEVIVYYEHGGSDELNAVKLLPIAQPEQPKKKRVGPDMICPETNIHCYDETCTIGAECNVSGTNIKKERIGVRLYKYSTGYCLIGFEQKLSDEQQRIVAAAVENVLNDDATEKAVERMFAQHLHPKVYTSDQLREAERKAFDAAREHFHSSQSLPRYDTFQDYLNSKKWHKKN